MNACGREDARGRCCFLGAGHTAKCRFGASDGNLSDRQRAYLADVVSGARTEHFGADSTAASLEKLGLVRRRPIGMRWWRLTATPQAPVVLLNGGR